MKKLLSGPKALILLLVVSILFLAFYAYMLARPISYGMAYRNVTEYVGGSFEGIIQYYPDKTMVNRNTNFDGEMKSYYYYKNGYVFFTVAKTEEVYNEEIADINSDFDAAVATPFYSAKINAFKQVYEQLDGTSLTYTCTSAVAFAVIGGVIGLALVGLTALSFFLGKGKSENFE